MEGAVCFALNIYIYRGTDLASKMTGRPKCYVEELCGPTTGHPFPNYVNDNDRRMSVNVDNSRILITNCIVKNSPDATSGCKLETVTQVKKYPASLSTDSMEKPCVTLELSWYMWTLNTTNVHIIIWTLFFCNHF